MQIEINKTNTHDLINSKQSKSLNYLSKRDELQKLIKTVIKKLRFDLNTLHLTNYFIDIVSLTNINLKLDLTAITCLFIAAKFLEINPYYEYFKDYRNFNNVFPYSVSEMRELEINIVSTMGFKLKLYTPYDCLKIFFTYGLVFSDDKFGIEATTYVRLSPVKILKNKNKEDIINLDITNPLVIDEIYQFCEQILIMLLEGKVNHLHLI
jgi:hypothetical protein